MIANDVLREKIVDVAIHGELIENDESLKKCDVKSIDIGPFEIPSNWVWSKIEYISTYKNGFAFNSGMMNKESTNGYPVIKSANIGTKEVIINSKTDYISNPTDKMLDCTINKNDILMVLSSQSANIEPLGVSAIYKLDTPALLNQRVLKIVCNNNVNPEYVLYVINSKWFHSKLSNKAAGLAQANLKLDHVLSMEVPIPPLKEQNKIVDRIKELHELLDKKEKNDKEKTKLKGILKEKILDKAIHGTLVSQSTSESNSEVLISHILDIKNDLISKKIIRKESNSNTNKPKEELPIGWNWIRLGDLGVFKKGPFGSSLTKDMFVDDGPNSYKVYEQKNAIKKNWKLGNYFITKDKFDSMQSFIVNPKDIIVSCAGTIGETYVIPDEARIGIINQALMKITLYDNSIMDYFLIYFDHVLKDETRNKGKGSVITNIPPFDILKNIYIPLPPLEEQKRIVERIDSLFELIEQL